MCAPDQARCVRGVQVLGTPSREDIQLMNPNNTEFQFLQIKAHPWLKVFLKRLLRLGVRGEQVLGTPSREDIQSMNPNYTEFQFPQIKAHPWSKVFSKRLPPDAVDLVRALIPKP